MLKLTTTSYLHLFNTFNFNIFVHKSRSNTWGIQLVNFLIFLSTSLLSLRCRQQIRRTCWPAANLLRHCIIPRLILAAAAPPFTSLAGVREPQLRLAVGITPSALLPPVAGAGGGS